jgi:hypothetical protein
MPGQPQQPHDADKARRPFVGFTAGTPILTPAGSVPIEHLKAGDLISTPADADDTAKPPAGHPFFIAGRGWVDAGADTDAN